MPANGLWQTHVQIQNGTVTQTNPPGDRDFHPDMQPLAIFGLNCLGSSLCIDHNKELSGRLGTTYLGFRAVLINVRVGLPSFVVIARSV